MRTQMHLLAVLGFVVAVVACGDSGTTKQTTPPPTTTTTTSATTTTLPTAQLEAMLLDAADVGAGWEIGSAVNAQDLADAVKVPCPDTAVNPTILERLTGKTGIQFSPTDRSYKHIIETLVTGDPVRLDKDMQVLFGAVQACPTVASTTPSSGSSPGTVTPTYRELTIPKLGDQRMAAVLIGVESPQATWYVRSAMVRVGSVAMTLGLTEILATPQDTPKISDAEFVKLVETAVAKLSG